MKHSNKYKWSFAVLFMNEPNIKDLPSIQDFRKEREELEKDVSKIGSLTAMSNISLHFSRFYKTIAGNTLDGQVRADATEEAKYFLAQAVGYANQYTMQREMLPEFFDRDQPV
ncbi:MAG: hypothetical protein AABW75_03140 [Nanoarchaeota archaeon]